MLTFLSAAPAPQDLLVPAKALQQQGAHFQQRPRRHQPQQPVRVDMLRGGDLAAKECLAFVKRSVTETRQSTVGLSIMAE